MCWASVAAYGAAKQDSHTNPTRKRGMSLACASGWCAQREKDRRESKHVGLTHRRSPRPDIYSSSVDTCAGGASLTAVQSLRWRDDGMFSILRYFVTVRLASVV